MTRLDVAIIERLAMVDNRQDATSVAADIVELCATEATRWTNRGDDAIRIPDVLYETAQSLRQATSCTCAVNKPDERCPVHDFP